MDQQIKAKWVKALRSGEYKQGYEKLHNTLQDTYCCLGVLCRVLNVPSSINIEKGHESFEGDAHTIPIKIRNEVGLTQEDVRRLMHMNDRKGKNFTLIADYIEANL